MRCPFSVILSSALLRGTDVMPSRCFFCTITRLRFGHDFATRQVMFDTISDPHTTPRNFAISSSVLLHFILILIIPLMRFNRAPTLVFHGAVYSANNKLIFPTPRQVVLSPRLDRKSVV